MISNNSLQFLGLSPKEIQIYCFLLQEGFSQVFKIEKQTKLHRPDIYKTIISLDQKYLLKKKIIGSRTFWNSVDPIIFESILEKNLKELKKDVDNLIEIKPKNANSFEILKGRRGIETAFLDVVRTLKSKDVFYRFSSTSNQPLTDSFVPDSYRPIRDSKKLERFLITNEVAGSVKKKRLERTIRFIPPTNRPFDYDVIQFIYADTTSYLDFNSLEAIIIRNKNIALFHKHIFLSLYKRL